jgi:hypothetical protein
MVIRFRRETGQESVALGVTHGFVDNFQFCEAEADQFIPVAPFKEDSSMVVGDSLHLSLEEIIGIGGVDDANGNAWVDQGLFHQE